MVNMLNLLKFIIMKKVFVVVSHAICDYEDCGIGTIVCSSKDKALKHFRSIVDGEKRAIDEDEWVVEEDEDSFCAYIDGEYSANMTMCEIREEKIE